MRSPTSILIFAVALHAGFLFSLKAQNPTGSEDGAQPEVEVLRNQLGSIEADMAGLQNEIQLERSSYDSAKSEFESLATQISGLQQRFEQMARQIDILVEQFKNIGKQQAELSEQRQLLERALEGDGVYRTTKYKTSYEARAAKTSLLSLCQSLGDEESKLVSSRDNAKGEYLQIATAIQRVGQEKLDALAEMRSGAFCSGCGKTRSEILALREEFPHPGQFVVPATEIQLQEAATRFDSQIETLNARLPRLARALEGIEADLASTQSRRSEAGSQAEVAAKAATELEWLEKGQAETRRRIAELKTEENDLESKKNAVKAQYESLRSEAKNIRAEIDRLQMERKQAIDAANKAARRLGDLTSRLKELGRKRDRLEAQVARLL